MIVYRDREGKRIEEGFYTHKMFVYYVSEEDERLYVDAGNGEKPKLLSKVEAKSLKRIDDPHESLRLLKQNVSFLERKLGESYKK
ncbi:hypothetical protein J4481_02365 [Candidatus Pacearchaeota archaeon]|nr:hypothetical protein [Candidatus Pacearchaeota archaeon]